MRLLFLAFGFAVVLFGCSGDPANSVSDFRPRQEVNISEEIAPAPNEENFKTAKRVFDSMKQYEDTDMWIGKVKLSIFGRDFELWITGSKEAPSEDYVQRLAETLSVVDDLKPLMEPPLFEYYQENKRFIKEVFGGVFGGMGVPEVADSSELWSALDFGILEYNSLQEQLAAEFEGREIEKHDGMTFSLLGDQPWNADDGTVVSVRGGKIIVASDASLFW